MITKIFNHSILREERQLSIVKLLSNQKSRSMRSNFLRLPELKTLSMLRRLKILLPRFCLMRRNFRLSRRTLILILKRKNAK